MLEKKLRKELIYFFLFTLASISSPVCAYVIPWMPQGESLPSWFQRSGAGMVVFALLAEARAISLFQLLNPTGFGSRELSAAKEIYDRHPASLNMLSFILIAVGTLIWGYGDIPFR
jgi:hypothetical protein